MIEEKKEAPIKVLDEEEEYGFVPEALPIEEDDED